MRFFYLGSLRDNVIEYLNVLEFPGFPEHKLQFQVGAVVMWFRKWVNEGL